MNLLSLEKCCRYTLLLVLAVSLTACSGENTDDLHQYVKEVKARKAITIAPLPKPVIYEAYDYQSDSQRDPFKEAFRQGKVASKQNSTGKGGPDLSRKRGYLESFPLDGLSFHGSIKLSSGMWGLIKTPEGSLVRVKVGDYLGQDYGKIEYISEGGIELRELISDGLGGWERRVVTLAHTE